MKINGNELMKNYIGKMYRVFAVIISLITVIELAFMIRGLCLFNLERIKLRLYLYSYIFLFASSLIALICLVAWRNHEKHVKKLSCMIYAYASSLVFWSAFITCIDCYADGDSGVMVYVMTSISVGILTLINPVFFTSLLTVSSISMLIAIYFARGMQFYSSGFYINFIVFIALAAFINAHNYKLSMREFEAGKLLRKLSYTDQLTNVYNRRRLDRHISARTKENEVFVFILMDIDDFKSVNDTFGHATGDRCLALLAKKLTEKFGKSVYRFGGDEFAIITEMTEADAGAAIDKINQELSGAFEGIRLHISAGIYKTREDDSAGSVFIKTDRALYDAKRSGKCTWAVYNSDNQ